MEIKDAVLKLVIGQIMPELARIESDRGAALTGAAYVESYLELLLRAFLIDDKEAVDSLFRVNNPLGSFEGKRRMAFCLGLVSVKEDAHLYTIQRIRNKFAHYLEFRSFEHPVIKDYCKNLTLSIVVLGTIPSIYGEPVVTGKEEILSRQRMRFTGAVGWLCIEFGKRLELLERHCVVRPDDKSDLLGK